MNQSWINKINIIISMLYAIALAIAETLLNWGNRQYAPLWIVDYLITIILLLGVFSYKKYQRSLLLLGWSFSAGVMYMVLFINLEPSSAISRLDMNFLNLVGLALIISLAGIVLTLIEGNN